MARDFYDVLGVDRGADDADLKRAFRKLARELHPDVNKHDPEAEAKFKQAAEAYEILSDVDTRRTYDTFGHDGLRSGGQAPHGFSNVEDILGSIFGGGDSVFGDLFGFSRRGPAAGADVGLGIEIELVDVLTGVKREVAFEAVSACEHCKGNGAEPGTPIRTCGTCAGQGAVQQVTRTAFGQMMRTAACPECHGDGRVPEQPCAVCSGAGRAARRRTYEVEIPAGIETGQRIRIGGAGHAGEAGAGGGDLYVEVSVVEDPRFERNGDHLVSAVRVPVTVAMLGGEVTVPTLEGERAVEIPKGAQPGETVVLKGLGLPSLRGGRRGHQHVVLDLVVPKKLKRDQRALAEKLDESIGARAEPLDRGGRPFTQ